MKIDHLSYSSISLYVQQCARAWKYRYVEKVKTPTVPPLITGSAFHRAVEDYIAAKATGNQSVTLSHLWPGAWAKQLEDPRNAVIDWGDETPESLDATGKRMLKNKDVMAAIDSIAPMVGMPFQTWRGESAGPMIERKITLRVPGVPIPIIGYIDIIADDGVPIDLKTSGRMWNEGRENEEIQPLFYLAALNQMGWTLNPEHRFRYVIVTKGKQPRVAVRETTRTIGQLFWLFDLIAEVWKGITAEVFPPNPNASIGYWKKCQPDGCEYWSMCRGVFSKGGQ